MAVKQCENCGDTFDLKVGGRPRFCKKCQWITKKCPVCGKEFKLWRTKAEHRVTCSFICKQKWCTSKRDGYAIRKDGKPGRRYHTADGYIRIYWPEHPIANTRGHVIEHRIVMCEKLGRTILPHERVHHINGIRDDNRPENLELRVPASHPNGIGELDMVKTLTELGYTVVPPNEQ